MKRLYFSFTRPLSGKRDPQQLLQEFLSTLFALWNQVWVALTGELKDRDDGALCVLTQQITHGFRKEYRNRIRFAAGSSSRLMRLGAGVVRL